MRRFFLCFALLSAMILMISCGDNSTNKINGNGDNENFAANMGELSYECYPNETCNKGLECDIENNICIKKSDENNTDKNDSENENSDTMSEESNENNDNSNTISKQDDDYTETNDDSGDKPDEASPCNPNPCVNVENSNGTCTPIDETRYSCWCKTNYTWDSSSKTCMQASKTAKCTGLPINAEWNTASEITQTWNGSDWIPTTAGFYNETASSNECRFKCKEDHTWDESNRICNPNPRVVNCEGLPENASWNLASSIIQNWNGTEWTPTSTGSYNETESSEDCRFKCNENYTWQDSTKTCKANSRVVNCDGLIENAEWNTVSTISQTWNGIDWIPSNMGIHLETGSCYSACCFKCKAEYHSENDRCVSNTRTNVACSGLPENAVWNTASEITQTWNGSDWIPSTVGVYSTSSSASKCYYKCSDAYHLLDYGECISNTKTDVPCTGLPDNAEWNSVSVITQNWNGTGWTPTTAGSYNTSSSNSECRYKCKENYNWKNSECVAKTRKEACTGLPDNAEWNSVSQITQTWNGTSWQPSTIGSYNEISSSVRCRFKCKNNYFYNGAICMNPCNNKPCDEFENTTGNCSASAYNEFVCECDRTHYWEDSECKPLPECSPTSGTPCLDSTHNLIWSAKKNGSVNEAVEDCKNLSEGGFTDWYLPGISELRTLIQNCPNTEFDGLCGVTSSCTHSTTCHSSYCSPSCPNASKFGDKFEFWSSTTPYDESNYDPVFKWVIDFSTGRVMDKQGGSRYFRCVR